MLKEHVEQLILSINPKTGLCTYRNEGKRVVELDSELKVLVNRWTDVTRKFKWQQNTQLSLGN